MKQLCQPSTDRISNLPPNVMERILTFLPIKEAGRTSILSTKWRFSWRNIPRLVFDGDFASVSSGKYQYVLFKIVTDILEALKLHDGPITEFVLAIPGLQTSARVDLLIRHLNKKGVKKLDLHFYDHNPFHRNVNASLFHAIQLTCLKLRGCRLPEAGLKVFTSLTVLELSTAAVPFDFFHTFLPKKCQFLQELRVSDCSVPPKLRLVAPYLKTFLLSGYFESIRFESAPLLSVVSIQLDDVIEDEVEKPSMVAMCASLPALQQLYVSFEFLELLAEGSVPYRLPAVLHHLRVVEVGSCSFPHYDGLLVEIVLFCLIRSSPNLHTLTMQMEAQGQAHAIPRQEVLSVSAGSEGYPENEDGCFQCLREVRILGSHGSQLELDLLKFVLAKAALLRRVVIKPSDELGCELGLRFLKEVTQYKRVSKDAEVIYVV